MFEIKGPSLMVVTGRKETVLLPTALHKRQSSLYKLAQAKQPI